MARVRIVSNISQLEIRRKTARAIPKNIAKATISKMRRNSSLEIRRHIKHTAKQIEGLLTTGVGSVSGGKRAKFSDIKGRGRYFSPVARWGALTRGYVRREPESRVLWRKHFEGTTTFYGQRPLLMDYQAAAYHYSVRSTAVTQKPVYRGTTTGAPAATGAQMYGWTVRITNMTPPLDTYIVGSMLLGTAQVREQRPTSNEGIRRIQYVEERRPLIGGVSARLGRDMLGELRRIPISVTGGKK